MAWLNDLWCSSLKNEGGWARTGRGGRVYNVRQRQLIYSLVGRPTAQTILLTHPDDPDCFLGFVCGELLGQSGGTLLHYVAVKPFMRQNGICHTLLDELQSRFPAGRIVCTHLTRAWLRTPRGKGMLYDPYQLLDLEDA